MRSPDTAAPRLSDHILVSLHTGTWHTLRINLPTLRSRCCDSNSSYSLHDSDWKSWGVVTDLGAYSSFQFPKILDSPIFNLKYHLIVKSIESNRTNMSPWLEYQTQFHLRFWELKFTPRVSHLMKSLISNRESRGV